MKKHGLILEGGGVKGAYQAGAMKALAQYGVQFDGVAGTSIGAVNGALYLQGGCELLQKVWQSVKFSTIYDFTDEEIERIEELQIVPALKEYIKRRIDSKATLIEQSYQKSQEFFSSIVDEDCLRASGKDYGLVTFDVTSFKPVEIMMRDIASKKLVDYIIASATFPIFPPKIIDGIKYVDGGVYDNMPINLLSRNGYDKMLIIRTNTELKPPKRKLERDDLQLYFLSPQEDLGPAMAFSSSRVKKFMDMGYEDATIALNSGLGEFLDIKTQQSAYKK